MSAKVYPVANLENVKESKNLFQTAFAALNFNNKSKDSIESPSSITEPKKGIITSFIRFNKSQDVGVEVTNNNSNRFMTGNVSKLFQRKKRPFVDPPLPKHFGKTVDITALIERNKKAKYTFQETIAMAVDDVSTAHKIANNIPVTQTVDRIQVTPEIYNRILQSKTKRDIKRRLKSNMDEIQRGLIYRQSLISVMNANYSKKIIAEAMPVDIYDARSIVITK